MAQKVLSVNAQKIGPLRPAPPPPSVANPISIPHNHVQSTLPQLSRMTMGDSKKKKNAPPRPPPPKASSSQLRAAQHAVVFTEMLQPKRQSQTLVTSSTAPDSLINWESPPTSPTPGRSSSDGLSLRSFGSDSSGTATSISLSGGLHLQGPRSESGFESEPDIWTISETVTSVSRPSSQPSNFVESSSKPFSMPTIIRPNRSSNKALPSQSSGSSTHLKALEKVNAIPSSSSGYFSNSGSSSHLADLLDLDLPDQWTGDGQDYSPPEPSMPPPPAPVVFELTESPPPPAVAATSKATALALYDYQSPHPGDLNFKEGDRIVLKSRVNEEWFQGSINSVEGMFPVSFVRVLVPLSNNSAPAEPSVPSIPSAGPSYRAVAIYSFAAESSQDLSLQEGDMVIVNESLGCGWLYGQHCQSGRQGQFPESFVRKEY